MPATTGIPPKRGRPKGSKDGLRAADAPPRGRPSRKAMLEKAKAKDGLPLTIQTLIILVKDASPLSLKPMVNRQRRRAKDTGSLNGNARHCGVAGVAEAANAKVQVGYSIAQSSAPFLAKLATG
ncbi:hypothetical protein R3P38DRAFT_2772049 [Favolaschia claudopus]|uniref:Uncharacterized protein n=1 Tax=Favolaschia claudopus TaxID=2862362 RepID=A0AAW0C8N6_9AGAR